MKLILLFLFLISLLGATADFGYEQIKIVFFIFSISLIGFIWLLGRPEIRWSIVKITSVAFILILIVTSATGVDLNVSILGSDPYFQGWIIYAYLGLFSVMVASSKISFKIYASVLVLSASLVSVCAIRQWVELDIFNLPVSTYAGRVVSTFGQPNFYAGFLLLTLPFSYYLLVTARRDIFKWLLGWISGLLSMVAILVSFSRTAILLTLLLLILGLIAQLKIKLKMWLLVFGVICISVVIALKFSSGIVGQEVSLPILTKDPDLTRESVENRVYIWPVAWQLIQQRPLTGYGLENIGQAFANYFEDNKHLLFEENLNISPVLISLKELNIDRSHNYILDLLLFSGIPGFLAWIILVVLLFKKILKLKHLYHGRSINENVLGVSLIAYLVWIQFQNQSIVHLIYFWLLVGLVDGY